MNSKKLKTMPKLTWYVVVGIIFCFWLIISQYNQQPFLSVAVDGIETPNNLHISICEEILPIKGGEILHYYNHCEGEVFMLDNLNQKLSEGVYFTSSFQTMIIFQKHENTYAAIVIYDSKY